jgi:hypothetical protein
VKEIIKLIKLAERLKQVVAAISSVLPSTSNPPSTTDLPSTTLVNMGAADAEEQAFQAEVKQLQAWWSEPRWRYTRRAYTAEQIASKRGNLTVQYPSNAMSKKLWKTVEQRFAVRKL